MRWRRRSVWKSAADVLTEIDAGPPLSKVVPKVEQRYRFHASYHPYVPAFISELNRNGVDGLLQRRLQLHPEEFMPAAPGEEPPDPTDFVATYKPKAVPHRIVVEPYPVEDADFVD